MITPLDCVVLVVVVGMVMGSKIASGALVVGPTKVATLRVLLALLALSCSSRRSVMSIRAVQPVTPAVAVIRQLILSRNSLTTRTHTHQHTRIDDTVVQRVSKKNRQFFKYLRKSINQSIYLHQTT